jgi:hypothetical protein
MHPSQNFTVQTWISKQLHVILNRRKQSACPAVVFTGNPSRDQLLYRKCSFHWIWGNNNLCSIKIETAMRLKHRYRSLTPGGLFATGCTLTGVKAWICDVGWTAHEETLCNRRYLCLKPDNQVLTYCVANISGLQHVIPVSRVESSHLRRGKGFDMRLPAHLHVYACGHVRM